MRKILATSLALAGIWMTVTASMAATPQEACTSIAAALDRSAVAWSKGDLASFMQVYENAPSTTYIGKDGPVHGYDAIAARYARSFGHAPGGLGQLSFTILDCRKLGAAFALVTGRFALHRPAPAGEATGIFTLVFHHSASGWGIIMDHTS